MGVFKKLFKDKRSREPEQVRGKLSVGVFKKLFKDNRSRELWQVRRKLSVGVPRKPAQGQPESGTEAGTQSK